MPGGTPEKTEKQTAQSTSPWAPAQPMLMDILRRYGGMNTDVTGGQAGALGELRSAAGNIPNFGGQATGLAENLFSGGGANANAPMLTGAYDSLRQSYAPMLSPDFVNPYSNPAITGALDTMRGDITNSIRGKWAAAGRTGSPGELQALGRGISQGQAPVLMDQYNKNLAAQAQAIQGQFGAGGATATGLANMNQMDIGNRLSGMGVAGAVPGMLMQPGQARYGVENMIYGQPYQNLGMLQQGVGPIAAMGSQSQGTETSTKTPAFNPWTTALGVGMGAAGLMTGNPAMALSGFGGMTGMPNFGGSMMPSFGTAGISDERAKENIEPVGTTFDDQTIYGFNYKGSPVPHIGLLAQEVEERYPEAVVETPIGLKAVDYSLATRRARKIGMLGVADDLAA